MPRTHTEPPPSPGTREEADALHVKDLYNGLQLGLGIRRQRDFLALTRAWLLRYSPAHRLPLGAQLVEIDIIVDDACLAFLFLFGARLWPRLDQLALRAHLREGAWLQYERDVVRQPALDAEYEMETGRPPSFYGERFRCLPLRQAVTQYFARVDSIEYEVTDGERDGVGIDELFAKVVEGGYETVGMGTLEE
ncbi:hypothetical protein B0A55_00070 [Friedmanniomyces simplex]|uniref:Uncharacterized protein n=1 Tax=Friedmanniomyces simplex TaxID=329884 RepID=A0A4U0Y0Y3_9PEZI|nr:hypothetical protein B0A55_00070 [Friedmanniomyces simplex]